MEFHGNGVPGPGKNRNSVLDRIFTALSHLFTHIESHPLLHLLHFKSLFSQNSCLVFQARWTWHIPARLVSAVFER